MVITPIAEYFSLCKVEDYTQVDLNQPFCFTGRTDQELSLVCPTRLVPGNATHREAGWKAFRLEGTLDFSLIGILAKISTTLAQEQIGIFAISTYNTDYVLTRADRFEAALAALRRAGYTIA